MISTAPSVVIPWRDRPELGDTLSRNREHVPNGAEWVVINGGGSRDAVRSAVAGQGTTLVNLPMRRWAKGLVQNVGVSFARAGWILLLDADVVLDQGAWDEMRQAAAADRFVTLARVRDLRGAPPGDSAIAGIAYRTLLTVDGRTIEVETSRFWTDEEARSGPGVVLLSREQFHAIGGLNGAAPGGHWLDIDMIIRLEMAGYSRVEAGEGEHVDPAPEARGQTRSRRDEANARRCMDLYSRGVFTGTYDRDVSFWVPLAEVGHP